SAYVEPAKPEPITTQRTRVIGRLSSSSTGQHWHDLAHPVGPHTNQCVGQVGDRARVVGHHAHSLTNVDALVCVFDHRVLFGQALQDQPMLAILPVTSHRLHA